MIIEFGCALLEGRCNHVIKTALAADAHASAETLLARREWASQDIFDLQTVRKEHETERLALIKAATKEITPDPPAAPSIQAEDDKPEDVGVKEGQESAGTQPEQDDKEELQQPEIQMDTTLDNIVAREQMDAALAALFPDLIIPDDVMDTLRTVQHDKLDKMVSSLRFRAGAQRIYGDYVHSNRTITGITSIIALLSILGIHFMMMIMKQAQFLTTIQ